MGIKKSEEEMFIESLITESKKETSDAVMCLKISIKQKFSTGIIDDIKKEIKRSTAREKMLNYVLKDLSRKNRIKEMSDTVGAKSDEKNRR